MPIETRVRNNCYVGSCLLLRTPESGRGAAGVSGGGSIGDRRHDKWRWQRRYVRRGGAVGERCGGDGKWGGEEDTETANNKKVLRNSLGLSALQDGLEPTTP